MSFNRCKLPTGHLICQELYPSNVFINVHLHFLKLLIKWAFFIKYYFFDWFYLGGDGRWPGCPGIASKVPIFLWSQEENTDIKKKQDIMKVIYRVRKISRSKVLDRLKKALELRKVSLKRWRIRVPQRNNPLRPMMCIYFFNIEERKRRTRVKGREKYVSIYKVW